MIRAVFGAHPLATVLRIAAIVAAAIVIFGFVLKPVRLEGISMLPTYKDGDFDFANRLAYLWREPARGDVVAIRMAGPSVLYVKRIVGLPRETVEIKAGVVLIDGERLVEPTVVFKAPWTMPAVRLGGREYFVIGDNRSMAMQDHDFGRASRDRIVGKMLF